MKKPIVSYRTLSLSFLAVLVTIGITAKASNRAPKDRAPAFERRIDREPIRLEKREGRRPSSFSAEEIEAAYADPSAYLNEQLALIEQIRPQVESIDIPRLDMIRDVTETTLKAVLTYEMGHKTISDQFLDYFVRYEFSEAFFDQIDTQFIRPRRTRLFEVVKLFKQTYGYETTPYAQILSSVLAQMQRLNDQLMKLSIPADLEKELDSLRVPLGYAIGKAGGQGDRPNSFAAAKPIHAKVKSLYSRFYEFAGTESIFKPMLELQALNEFLGKYGQFD